MEKFLNKIVYGDSLELLKQLPDDCIDAVVTDPPYCSGGRGISEKSAPPSSKYEHGSNKLVHRPDFIGDSKDTRAWLHWCILWINECYRVLKKHGYFLMFTDWRQLPSATDAIQMGEIIWRGIIAWDKGNASRAPHKGYFRHQCEYIVWGTKDTCKKAVHAGPYSGCYKIPVLQKDKFHLTGKPTALMSELVKIVPEGAVILDPFAGSGTTAVAAKLHNRQFIGFEKTKLYYDIAVNRVSLKEIKRSDEDVQSIEKK